MKCSKCGKDINTRIELMYDFEGQNFCWKCLDILKSKKPYLVIDSVDNGGDRIYKLVTFSTMDDLVHLLDLHMEKGDVLVCDKRNIILRQDAQKDIIKMIGYVKNYNIANMNLPTVDYTLYNKKNEFDVKRAEKWLANKFVYMKK